MRNDWIDTKEKVPEVGEWVLMFLVKEYAAGVDRFRAGLYMGPDDWMSGANWKEPKGLLPDRAVSHYILLIPPGGFESTYWVKIYE